MNGRTRTYKGIVSSDWSECLSPSGPFDPMVFTYPELESELSSIFRRYTGNLISLTEATNTIKHLLPEPLTRDRMDAYLDASFRTYTGVPDLIEWCLAHDILFMINTTGMQGYFQRALAKALLPRVPVVAANPMIHYSGGGEEVVFLPVTEIEDKPKNTRAAMQAWGVPPGKLVVIGDSGGDGPHFQWGATADGFLIGSMTKDSLERYCRKAAITIPERFGMQYGPGATRDVEHEMRFDFKQMVETIRNALDLKAVGGAIR